MFEKVFQVQMYKSTGELQKISKFKVKFISDKSINVQIQSPIQV